MKVFLLILPILAVWIAPLACGQEEQSISISSRAGHKAPVIIISSKYNFEREISLKLKTDPALTPSEALIRTVSKFGMVDAKGIKITSGFDIDLNNNLVVAFSGGTSEIIKVAGDPTSLEIIASFKDEGGNFVSPPLDSVAVYNLKGEKLCFDYTTINKDPKIAITLLLDKSGSMYDHMDAVKTTARHFLNILPKKGLCAVGSFDTTVSYAHKDYQSCGDGGFGFEGLTSGGGTDIYNALGSAYDALGRRNFNGFQKAVIVITDGYTKADPQRKAYLYLDKKDVLTYVYFIGGDKKDELLGITDHFFANNADIKQSLTQYFGAIGQGFNAQKILRVKALWL